MNFDQLLQGHHGDIWTQVIHEQLILLRQKILANIPLCG